MNSKSIHQPFLLGLLAGSVLLGACVLLGCSRDTPSSDGETPSSAVTPGDSDEDFTHVLTVETEYYLGGPQQARPPDGQFTAGVKVKLIEQAGSYSQVESESGITAYVATDAIQRIEDETGN